MAKTVWITGASAGIGAALAREYARKGCDLLLTARRQDRLDVVVKECQALNPQGRIHAGVVDVRDEGAMRTFVREGVAALGRLDVAVANAGFAVVAPFEALTPEDYRRQWDTNVFGVLHTAYAALDELKKSRGSLVIVGSVNSLIATPLASAYCSSKFAVRALADSWREELKAHGVAVTLICPGFVSTEISRVDNSGVFRPERKDMMPRELAISADSAARSIAGAIDRRVSQKVITGHGKALVALDHVLPGSVVKLMGLFPGRKPRNKWKDA